MTENEAISILSVRIGGVSYAGKVNEALEIARQALKEVQQYREVGTVEECREAVEKQKPKKIVYGSDSEFCDGFTRYRMGKCPMCDRWYISNGDVNYCSNCGQAISWE